MPLGADIKEITWNHPTLGSGVMFPKAAEEGAIDYGGYRSNDDANGIDGGGRPIYQLSAVRWKVESVISWDQNVNLDLKKITEMAGAIEDADWTITSKNGQIWGGKGRPVGEYSGATLASTFPLVLAGGGELKEI